MTEREIGRVRDGVIVRPPVAPRTPGSRSKREAFTLAAAVALEVPVAEVDLEAPLSRSYGADELQILECIQAAEDIWGERIAPAQIPVDKCPSVVGRFPTLASIMLSAESAAAAG